MVIRDIGLHMSNRAMDYCSEDAGLCRGALDTQRLQDLPFAKTELSSVQEFLETSQFVQASFILLNKDLSIPCEGMYDAVRTSTNWLLAVVSSVVCGRAKKIAKRVTLYSALPVCRSLPDRHAQLSGRVPTHPFASSGASRRVHRS